MESVDPFAPPLEADQYFNPYEAPRAEIEALDLAELKLEKLASGQRFINYAILTYMLYFLSLFLYGIATASAKPVQLGWPQPPPSGAADVFAGLSWLGYLFSILLGIVGIVRVGGGLGIHFIFRVFLIPLMIVPLPCIVILFRDKFPRHKEAPRGGLPRRPPGCFEAANDESLSRLGDLSPPRRTCV